MYMLSVLVGLIGHQVVIHNESARNDILPGFLLSDSPMDVRAVIPDAKEFSGWSFRSPVMIVGNHEHPGPS